jgi:hypothetical protein
MIHGIELRGRTHPEEVLPILAEVQDDPDKENARYGGSMEFCHKCY